MKQQTTIPNISCKQTHLLAMRLYARLKLDGVFVGARSKFVVQGPAKRWKSCSVFIPNCACPCVLICVSGIYLYMIYILLLCRYSMIMWCFYAFVLHVIRCLRRCVFACVYVWYGHQIKQSFSKCVLLTWIGGEFRHFSTFHWGSQLWEHFSFVVLTGRVHVKSGRRMEGGDVAWTTCRG